MSQLEQVWNQNMKHVLYNLVSPADVHLYQSQGVPVTSTDNPDSSWFVLNNSSLVPVVAVGFEDLIKRIKQQELQSQAHASRLKECTEGVEQLFNRHQIHTSVTLNELKRRHVLLVHRVLQILVQVNVLRNAGYPIRPQEEILASKLVQLSNEMTKVTKIKLMELEAKANQLGSDSVTFSINDEQQLDLIKTALADTYNGLQILSETLVQGKKKVQEMLKGYSEK